MRVQVVLHQTNPLCLGVVVLNQALHELSVIDRGASLSHFDIAKTSVRFKGQQHTAGTVLFVFIVVAFGFPRRQGENQTGVFDQKTRPLIKVDQGTLRIIRQFQLVEYIFQVP